MSNKKELCVICKKKMFNYQAVYTNRGLECVICAKYPYTPPYSIDDYDLAKQQGLDLDNWNDYEKYFQLGENESYD